MTVAIETTRLGRRYGRRWALQECSLSLPAGRVIGLVGPNGAGETTLLHMAVGLLTPSAGEIRVLGTAPRDRAARAGVAFLAQDKPLYRRFTVADTLRMAGGSIQGSIARAPAPTSLGTESRSTTRSAVSPAASKRRPHSRLPLASAPSYWYSTSL
jgi:ABC-type multidrug transport system ATPase subunit